MPLRGATLIVPRAASAKAPGRTYTNVSERLGWLENSHLRTSPPIDSSIPWTSSGCSTAMCKNGAG